ncbi:MAG: hypothetical protein Q4D65_03820 [Peptostreptococcaceae bacterium]|nr:hypothetical protein [Peptostreptococcaceae bacterium]
MNKTIQAFRNDISNSDKIKQKLLENIKTKGNKEFVLNTVELSFDFSNENVEIGYYRIDEQYPVVNIGFEELKKIIAE